MKTNFLFPNYFKPIGRILLIPAAIVGYMVIFRDFTFSFLDIKVLSLFSNKITLEPYPVRHQNFWMIDNNNFTDEMAGILFIIGALFVAFSKEKDEDEYIAKIRLDSIMWATYTNYIIVIASMLFLYDFTFSLFMMINMFTILILFILRFNFLLFKSKYRKL